LTTYSFASIFGCSTLIAPSKKNFALLSSGEPANSSMLHGLQPLAVRPSMSDWPWITPTLKLSNDA
jgi:hypothetical protein